MYPRPSGAQSQAAIYNELINTTFAGVPLTSEQSTKIKESIATTFTDRITLSAEDQVNLDNNMGDYKRDYGFDKNSYNPETFSGDYDSPGEMFTDEDSSVVKSLESFFLSDDGRKLAIRDGRDILVNGVTIPGGGEQGEDVQVPITMDMLNDAVQSLSDRNFATDDRLYTLVQEYAVGAGLYKENKKYKEQQIVLDNMEREAKLVGGSADSLNSPSSKAMRQYGGLLNQAQAREKLAAEKLERDRQAAIASNKEELAKVEEANGVAGGSTTGQNSGNAPTTTVKGSGNAQQSPLGRYFSQSISKSQNQAAAAKTLNTAVLSANTAQDFSKLTDTDISSWIRANTQVGQRGRNNAPSAVVNSVKNILNQRNNP
jgi:hypothetical protein